MNRVGIPYSSGSTREPILTSAPKQRVVPGATIDHVSLGTAPQRIGPLTTLDSVIAIPAEDGSRQWSDDVDDIVTIARVHPHGREGATPLSGAMDHFNRSAICAAARGRWQRLPVEAAELDGRRGRGDDLDVIIACGHLEDCYVADDSDLVWRQHSRLHIRMHIVTFGRASIVGDVIACHRDRSKIVALVVGDIEAAAAEHLVGTRTAPQHVVAADPTGRDAAQVVIPSPPSRVSSPSPPMRVSFPSCPTEFRRNSSRERDFIIPVAAFDLDSRYTATRGRAGTRRTAPWSDCRLGSPLRTNRRGDRYRA